MSKKGFTYTLQLDAEISNLLAKTAQVKKSMESIMAAGKAPGAQKTFTNIEQAIDRLRQKASQPIESTAAFEGFQKDVQAVGNSLSKLTEIVNNLSRMDISEKMDLLPPDLKHKIEEAGKSLNTFNDSVEKAKKKSEEFTVAEKTLADAQKELAKAQNKVAEKKEYITKQEQAIKTAKDEAAAILNKKNALEKFLKTQEAYEAAGGDKRRAGGGKEELAGLNLPADRKAATAALPEGFDIKDVNSVQAAIAQLNDEYSQANKVITDVEDTQRRYTKSLSEWQNKADIAGTKVDILNKRVEDLNKEFEENKAKDVQAAYTKLRNEASKLGIDLKNIPVEYTEQNFLELNTALNQLAVDGIAKVDQGLDAIQTEMVETSTAADKLGSDISKASTDISNLDTQVRNTEAFTQRIAQFVGLQGGIEIARKAMRNAISTIKDLDAAMTEMAVVTDLGVSDYWDQLPEHTSRANELGMSIKSVYEAETLYYQQGLKTNEVVEMSTETLKMARIAGLSAEDATNKMTAALRGFNMELNETSAQRVADVYSELAAITASDVNEISSAMTKTASIAANAGMEFETTAAFLSQIIETTRESAETAGTAMKTVIARFQELKKDPAEIGEVDGEIVDANKIETALRTVGVSLRDARGQFRELDDVFLELSSKWDSLDTNTQRYIATIAAGSRQQSRFIAMMSDYGRTQELVAAANNSAGASNKQFEKTMDSLESKLKELKNAWDSFTMGIMDSEILKTGIELLTGILTAINNITDAFGDFSGAAKIGLLITALYLGDKALAVFTKSIKEGGTILQSFGQVGKSAIRGASESISKLNTNLIASNIQAKKLASSLKLATGSKFTKNTQDYKKAITQQTKATKEATDRENAYKVAMFSSRTSTDQLNKARLASVQADQAKAAADAEVIASEQALAATLGLTSAQEAEANAIRALGVSYDQAAIIASAGYTAAEIQEQAATSGVTAAEIVENQVKQESTRQTTLAAIANFILTSAYTLQTQGLKGLIKSWWAQLTAKFADIKATWAQTAANIGLQVSMWPILVVTLLIVAAIGALVLIIWALVSAFKAAQKNSPAGKLKSAEEAADAAAEAADRATEAYNDLSDAFDSLSDKYNTLEELTRGSREWKDAVREVNQEVLDLIDKYPELAKFVDNSDGYLKLDIESDEVQNVLDEYDKKAVQTRAASYAAQINVNEKKAKKQSLEIAQENMALIEYQTAGSSESSPQWKALSDATIQAMSRAMTSGDLMETDGDGDLTNEMTEWLQKNGVGDEATYAADFAAGLKDATDSLQEFGTELQTMDLEEALHYEQMAQGAINSLDAGKFSQSSLKVMDVAATADFSKTFNEASQKKYQEAVDAKDWDTINKAKEDVAKNLYGKDATVNGNKITYYDENGEKQTKELTDEEFKEQWAAIDATRNMTAAFEQLPKTINKVSSMMTKEAGKAFKAMYKGEDGSAMTKADIEAAQEMTADDLWKLWANLTEEERKAYGEFETFQTQYNDTVKAAQDALNQAQEIAAEAGVELIDNISVQAARGYAEQMRNVVQMNEVATKELEDSLNSVVGTLNETDKTNFFSALNALDWQSVESLETLPETIEAMGVAVPQELENYIELLKESTGAIRNIDLQKLKEASVELANLKKSISGGEQGRTFSEEAYKALTEMAPDLAKDFQLGLDGQYTYLGSAMEDLTIAIEANTEALLAEVTETLNNKLTMAQLTNKMYGVVNGEQFSFSEMASEFFDSEEAQKNVLKLFQQNMKENEAEIVGIEGFGNNTAVDELSGDKLDKIFQQLVASAAKMQEYQNDLNNNAVQTAAIQYQANSAVENAYGADMLSYKTTKNTEYELRDLEGFIGGGPKSVLASTIQSKSTRYDDASEDQQREFNARNAALMTQASAAGVNSQIIDQYAKIVDQYKKGEVAYSKVLEVQRQVANSTDYNNMKKNLQSVFEKIGDVKEAYDKIADGDVAGKINMANDALAIFGASVDSVYDANKYMQILDQVSQGNTDAMNQLVAFAQESAGLAVSEYGNAYSQGWENLSEAQIAFFDEMQNAGMGTWKILENGMKEFVWATAAEMQTVAELAGTAFEAWEMPYTWLYNYNEEINRLTREREKNERAYARILEDENSSAQDLLRLQEQELTNLQQQAQLQSAGALKAQADINSLFAENSKFSKYVRFDASTNEILMGGGIESAGFSEEEGAEFEEFISKLEESRDAVIEAEDALLDIEDQIKEIENRGRDETSELYDQIKEGLVQSRQKEIDKLSDINDSIQDAQSRLLEKMQQQIEEERQARENEKIENEISDKEARLAYLMRDTTGANDLEIMSLQQEIETDKQSYEDSLIDQSLQKLQDANEKAAEQRQSQITLMQTQLDAYAESEQIWTDVKNILDSSLAQANAAADFDAAWAETDAAGYAAIANGTDELNPIKKEQEEANSAQQAKLASVYSEMQNTNSSLNTKLQNTKTAVDNAKQEIIDNQEAMGTLGTAIIQPGFSGVINAIGKIPGSSGTSSGGGKTSGSTKTTSTSTASTGTSNGDSLKGTMGAGGQADNPPPSGPQKDWVATAYPDTKLISSDGAKPLNTDDIKNGKNDSTHMYLNSNNYKEWVKCLKNTGNNSAVNSAISEMGLNDYTIFSFVSGPNARETWYLAVGKKGYEIDTSSMNSNAWTALKSGRSKVYKTGGLADYTGPAWLDGTKSKPELVLNARDTANFIQLKDILADFMNNTNKSSTSSKQSSGDNYYDVQINVDSIGDDYDVEQLADKIRDLIYKDSVYRNVNAINLIR